MRYFSLKVLQIVLRTLNQLLIHLQLSLPCMTEFVVPSFYLKLTSELPASWFAAFLIKIIKIHSLTIFQGDRCQSIL